MGITKHRAEVPKDGLQGLKENFIDDLGSGFMVSMLALPLSLGIAQASEFPNPMYGVLTAIIGGMLVSIFSGSRLTIKGPAAGLIVVLAGAVTEFGGGITGWQMALTTIIAAGFVQIVFGLLKFGSFSEYFPLTVVHAMMTAIGLIIISRQLHVLNGINPVGDDGKPLTEPMALLQAFPQTIQTIPERWPFVITGWISLILVFAVPKIKLWYIKKLPVPLIVLFFAVPVGLLLGLSQYKNGLVHFNQPFTQIIGYHADFGGLNHLSLFLKYVVLFAMIGSLESLLTVKAIDMLDPFRRKSNADQDLIAVGGGNILAAFIGGLPMISEVARSSANVNNGAKTRWANFFHGSFLLIFMLLLSPLIQKIPNAALAAMLIGVGFRLAHPKGFIQSYRSGIGSLFIFITTILVTLTVDLLAGVFAGIFLKFIVHLVNGVSFKQLFQSEAEVVHEEGCYRIVIKKAAIFSNWPDIRKKIQSIPRNASVCIDLNACEHIDHSVIENLLHIKQGIETGGGKFEIVGGHHPLLSEMQG